MVILSGHWSDVMVRYWKSRSTTKDQQTDDRDLEVICIRYYNPCNSEMQCNVSPVIREWENWNLFALVTTMKQQQLNSSSAIKFIQITITLISLRVHCRHLKWNSLSIASIARQFTCPHPNWIACTFQMTTNVTLNCSRMLPAFLSVLRRSMPVPATLTVTQQVWLSFKYWL